MAQPRDYTRQYNFNDFQTTSPSDPLPGNEVDNELNAVKLTLDDLNENIEKIQRDDGKLKNQAVHKDAFDAGALALVNADSFNPRGDWVTARAYAINDIVDFNGATYLATVAHTSSAAFGTDQDADKWILLANAAISTTASAVDKYEGDGSQTVFTLQYNYAGDTSALVFVNGALRNPGDDYTISGNTITFVTAPSTPSVAGNENVIVWGASVVAQAAKEDAEAAESNASGFADEAEDWASKTTGQVESTDYSSKAYAIGGTGVDTGDGSAKDWATKTSAGVGNTSEYSAKEYAQGTQSGTGGSAKDWAQKTSGTVDGTNYSAKYWATDTNVTNVGSNISDVQTVAGEISPTNNIATVAGDSVDIQTVASDSADIQQVADDSADIRTLADIQDGTTATNAISDVASIATNVTQVGPNINDVVTVAGQISPTNNIATVAGDSADIQTVAGDSADIQQVADDSADIRIVADLQDGTTATNAISDLAAIASNITTVATNVQDVNNFAETYYISATEPQNTTLGDLWFDTTDDVMKVKASGGFVNAGSAVNGTAQRESFKVGTSSGTYTGSTTVFPATYDAGYVDVYRNGIKLVDGAAPDGDFVATNGTSITLNSAASANDTIDIVAYGTFELSTTGLDDLVGVSVPSPSNGNVLKYDGTNWVAASADLVDDTTPQLGADLDGNTFSIDLTSATDSMGLPVGTTAQEPTPTAGHIRYDSDKGVLTYANGTSWEKVSAEIPLLTSVTGNLYDGLASTLTLGGSKFLTANLVVNFLQSADGINENVTVTPSSDTSATVAVPAAVYNNVTAGNAVTIKVTNSDGGQSGNQIITALGLPSGGTVTTVNGFRVHQINSTSNFVIPTGVSLNADYVIVAGGAGGGGWGGGGGAGGVIEVTSQAMTAGTYQAVIGGGGAAGTSAYSAGTSGGNSSFNGTTATGGGYGGHYDPAVHGIGSGNGGSGGGGAMGTAAPHGGGSGTSGQGNNGGSGGGQDSSGNWTRAGGGGGKGGAGTNGSASASDTGNGGVGADYSTNYGNIGHGGYLGGGGGGHTDARGGLSPSSGGQGGGGQGGAYHTANAQTRDGGNGITNTGGGGGGGYGAVTNGVSMLCGTGGSGTVLIRYQLS